MGEETQYPDGEEPTTMTGEPASEYSGPQANRDGEGHVILDTKFESYKFDAREARRIGEDLIHEAKKELKNE